MTKLIYVFLFSLAFLSCEQIKPDKEKERIDAVCDKFMQAFLDRKLSDVSRLLKQNSVLDTTVIDTLRTTIQLQMNNVLPSYGKMLSYQFILERRIKDFLVKRFYILKLEKSYLKFEFILYNNGTRWAITNFNYDGELNELFY